MFIAADAAMMRVLSIRGSGVRAAATVAALATMPVGVAISAAAQVAVLVAILAIALAAGARKRPERAGRMTSAGD